MYKKLARISLLILLNLLAFLLFGSILGALFGNKTAFLIGSIIFSMIPLTIIMIVETKKNINDLNNITKENKDDGNTK